MFTRPPKKLDDKDSDKPEPVKLLTQQRQDLLLATLEKDGRLDRLKEWPPELACKALALLLEFHHVFSLERSDAQTPRSMSSNLWRTSCLKKGFGASSLPWWMRCTNTFRRCWMAVLSDPPSCHGAMPWCWWGRMWVATVLHWLPLPEHPDQEGCLSLASHARDHGKHGWHLALFLLGLEEWVLAGQNGQRVQTVHCLYSREHGHVRIPTHALQAVQCPSNISVSHAKLSGELNLMYALIYLDNVIVYSKTEEEHLLGQWNYIREARR